MSAMQDLFRWIKERHKEKKRRRQNGSKRDLLGENHDNMKMSRSCAASGKQRNGRSNVGFFTADDAVVDRSKLELPPVPDEHPFLSNLPDISRDCARSPGHVYDEIPAYAIDSRRDILRHIRSTEMKKMNMNQLNFDQAKQYGPYLVVPIRNRTKSPDEGNSRVTRHESLSSHGGYLQDESGSDQLDQLVCFDTSLYRKHCQLPPYFDDPVPGSTSRDHREAITSGTDHLETCSTDSGMSSPSSHTLPSDVSRAIHPGHRGNISAHSQHLACDQTSGQLANGNPLTGKNSFRNRPPDVPGCVRDRRPIQTMNYGAFKQGLQTSHPEFPRHTAAILSASYPNVGVSRDVERPAPPVDGNLDDTFGEYDIKTDSSLSGNDYDFYLGRAKENHLLGRLVKGEESQPSTSSDGDRRDVSFDLTSVTSMSELSTLAEEEVQQLTEGMVGARGRRKSAPNLSKTNKQRKGSESGPAARPKSAFVPYLADATTSKSNVNINASASSKSNSSQSFSSPLARCRSASVGLNNDRLSCRATSKNPDLKSRRMSTSSLLSYSTNQGPSRRPRDCENKLLSEIMRKNHDRQILLVF